MRRVLVGLLISLVWICALAGGPSRTERFFREFTDEWVRGNPDLASATQYFTGPLQDRLESQLTPVSDSYRRSRIQLARKGVVELLRLNWSEMTETQRLSAQLMEWQLRMVSDEAPYLNFTFPLEQMNGANVGLVDTLIVTHRVLQEKDAAKYLAALKEVSTRMDEAMAESSRLAEKGIIPPTFILQVTIRQMREFVQAPPSESPFVTALVQQLEDVESLTEKRRRELIAEAERMVRNRIYPAWKKAILLLESQIALSSEDAGLWRFKDGDAAYAYFLRRYTSTNLTADEIYQIGLKEVARLEGEMDRILRQLGRTEGSLNERIAVLRKELQYPAPTSETSRAQIITDIEAMIGDAEKRSEALFGIRPQAPVLVLPFPEANEDSGSASYYGPSPDGARPGFLQFPRSLNNMTMFGLRSLVYHESVPGHHFQIALSIENPSLPRFRQIRAFGEIAAYTEGWALYAERLAVEAGWYDGDPEGLLGQLDGALFRARRLVVDTGLHAKHWTRQQAIDYGIEPSEVDRYVVYPGQACSYTIGELKFVEMRNLAERELGDKFSLRDFHDFILSAGTMPLEMLENQVRLWIQRTRRR